MGDTDADLRHSLSDEDLTDAPYTALTPAQIDTALLGLAHPYSVPLLQHLEDAEGVFRGQGTGARAKDREEQPTPEASQGRAHRADGLNFQPCAAARTEDRYVVEQLDVGGTLWTLTGVFDGHLGDATADHAAQHLPVIVHDALLAAHASSPARLEDVHAVGTILRDAIREFDAAIARDVLQLFDDGLGSGRAESAGVDVARAMDVISSLSDAQIRARVNDDAAGLVAYHSARLCMHGTTALIALVDPRKASLWVANLGDCQAVLATRTPDGWTAELLSRAHNGSNPVEVARVLAAHPGEEACIIDGRVLGAVAPFRCIGDHPFKLPAAFTRRVLYSLEPAPTGAARAAWDHVLVRNVSPPYISCEAEVVHRVLRGGGPKARGDGRAVDAEAELGEQFLVLCTDGLPDLYDGLGLSRAEVAQRYVDAVVSGARAAPAGSSLALHVLRAALGGDDADAVSRMVAVQADAAWMDDVTIVVQLL